MRRPYGACWAAPAPRCWPSCGARALPRPHAAAGHCQRACCQPARSAPPPPPPRESAEQIARRKRKEDYKLRELRIFLRDICRKLASNRRFYKFTKPVDLEEVTDYLDIIKQPMDLETMMTKVDIHKYNCAKEFLDDIDLICANALEYNPDRSENKPMITSTPMTNGASSSGSDDDAPLRPRADDALHPTGAANNLRDSSTPPPPPRESAEQIARRKRKEDYKLRELRIFLRDICRKLASNRRFYKFTKPVDLEEVTDYLDIIKQPMDLETMMTKVDIHKYNCAKEFLDDIDLICANALEYNPDSDFELECQEIARRRNDEGTAADNDLPDFIYTASNLGEYYDKALSFKESILQITDEESKENKPMITSTPMTNGASSSGSDDDAPLRPRADDALHPTGAANNLRDRTKLPVEYHNVVARYVQLSRK
ncbi:hypothetical protein MSG28_013358 [Choristoneura fumiferana]|uniref:Uncharacterized protein n=3 Tax=Choristoneura fumiferana TaxID=7141 RepID=A0ACC0KSR6_CHOFU|nr:hypothetical protein MSG28_013358 [Choristoneura fumiferana]KAI8439646.1 hypothetical protein MSG28_013358 [Choristoneura fumiferana]KAI8439647.1 hypothetical protein MSG28_013358 [Choristoneura fumiferana]